MEIIVNGSPYELMAFLGFAYYAVRHARDVVKQK